jgi:GAF domain-containing protein
VRVSLRELARSLGALGELESAGGAEQALYLAVDAARVLLDADTAGLLLADADAQLRWVIAVDRRAQTAGAAQERLALGPCVAAFEEGRPVAVFDVAADQRWAPVRAEMAAAGIGACLSAPVILAGGPVGVLDVYTTTPRLWDDSQLATAQSYAGVLSLLLGTALTAAAASELASQLQHALNARVQIEQAKGILMARHHISDQVAFERLRRKARASQRTVSAVARELLAEVSLDPGETGTSEAGIRRQGSSSAVPIDDYHQMTGGEAGRTGGAVGPGARG